MTLLATSRARAGLRVAGAASAALVLGGLLVGCGGDDGTAADDATGSASPSGSATPSDAASDGASDAASEGATDGATDGGFDLPRCDSVWVVGQALPEAYEGCLDADSQPVDAGGQYCEFGKAIFTFGDRFYAVEGGPVTQTEKVLQQDPQYKQAQRSCAG